MGLLDFLPDEWPGLLGSPIGRLPPQGPTAPMFVPPTEAAYGEPTPGELWNTNPSPLGKWIGGIPAALSTNLAEARARAMAPEPADHGRSERAKLSPLQMALNPITSYPETYLRMNQDARNQVSHGVDQLTGPETDQTDYPASGSEFDAVAPHPLSNVAKGAGNVALGTVGYVSSPIGAAYRSLLGQPLEDVTGLPRDYTEFAAQLATPGLGLLKIPGKSGVVPPRPAPNGPFGIASSEAQATQELPGKLPGPVGPATEAASATSDGSGIIPAARTETPELNGPMPEMAVRYPEVIEPIEKTDPITKKPYAAKQLSQEELRLKALRGAVQEIDKGHYPPHFDPAERFPADPANQPPISDTQNIRMVRPKTQEKYENIARSPEAAQRILEAFERGLQQKENAKNFSFMGQLENVFIKEYGPDQGRKLFKERFADSMAATTAGADPTANLMMALYANYLKARGQTMPTSAFEIPHPVGGRYVTPNMAQYQKMIVEGNGITTANPKRYNFSNDFLGHYSRRFGDNGGPPLDGPPIDERISRLFDPEMRAPPPGAYGHFQSALIDLAAEYGVDPQYFRDLVWAGASPDHPAKSMIQIINEAIERTHRITGMARDEIVRRGLVRAEIPVFGVGGIVAGKQLSKDDDGN
jgi:hypothetical protein